VYIFGNKPCRFPTGGNRAVRAVAAGERYLMLQNAAGERVYVNALPYPNEARLKEDRTEESFPEKMSRWIARGNEGYDGSVPYILLAHIFVAGGVSGESERNIELGGARAVPSSVLPDYGYVALGHLHKKQRIGEKGRYSGSLLQYAFDEANTEKSVVLLSTEGNSVRVEREIPLQAGKRLCRLEARGVDEALRLLNRYENGYIELTLHLTAPLTTRETQQLRESNAGLVSLITRVESEEIAQTELRSSLSPQELFQLYYQSKFGENPPEELQTAFLSLLSVSEEEA
ncbi:MAG: hypothetical protein K2H43_05495, partial [Clostridia bacterium]|nr:hypothetical protein [Clostridia bacterium]